jgi:hypothetical protein
VSKKLQEKQRKRLADQMRRERERKATRRSNLITISIALVIAALVVFGVFVSRSEDNEVPPAPEGVTAAEANCDEVEEPETEGREHVETSETVAYESSPPTSGNHWPPGAQADAGFYTDPIASESLVHNLEHGQLVIWYRPDAPQETISGIEGVVENANDPDNPDLPAQSAQPLIAVPYDDVPEGMNLVMTAWGALQACENYSLDEVNAFRESYQGRGPEQVTATFQG